MVDPGVVIERILDELIALDAHRLHVDMIGAAGLRHDDPARVERLVGRQPLREQRDRGAIMLGVQAAQFARPVVHVEIGLEVAVAAPLELPLDVGGIVVNDVPSYRVDNMPYGGVKDSGLGREGIRFAMEDMSEIRNTGGLLALPASPGFGAWGTAPHPPTPGVAFQLEGADFVTGRNGTITGPVAERLPAVPGVARALARPGDAPRTAARRRWRSAARPPGRCRR